MYKTRNQRKEEKKRSFVTTKIGFGNFVSVHLTCSFSLEWIEPVWFERESIKKHYCTKLFCFSGEQKWCILMITVGTRRCVLNSLFHYLFSQSVCFLISLLIVSLALIFFFFDFGITSIWVTHNFFFRVLLTGLRQYSIACRH
jgi:hypothetical protein